MWEVVLVATMVLTDQSTCQSLAVLSSPCRARVTFLSLTEHGITSKIFILDRWHGREPSAPGGQRAGGCSPAACKPQPAEALWMRLTTRCRLSHVQVTGPLRKGIFWPTTPRLQHPQAEQRGSSSHPGLVLTLHILPMLTLAAAPAGFWVIENIPAGRA